MQCNECFVIPVSEEECKNYAIAEAKDNWKSYSRGTRSIEQLQKDIAEGKLAELRFALQNKKSIVKGIRVFGSKPDGGIDLVLEKVGNVQIKVNHSSEYVNDLHGMKRDSWPSVDFCLLVVAFIDKDGSMQFMCQAPSRLCWKKSKFNDGWYLEKHQFIQWTDDEDVFAQLGTFRKTQCSMDDVPEIVNSEK